MSLSDPIADMLTRIRNAYMGGLEVVEIPCSNMKTEITKVLKREGFISDYAVEGGAKKMLRIYLKYTAEQIPAIQGIKRASRPGLRKYVDSKSVPRVLGGMGIAILTTSKGVVTDKEAREGKLGGEVLCHVW